MTRYSYLPYRHVLAYHVQDILLIVINLLLSTNC